MRFDLCHPWNLTPSEAIAVQHRLAKEVRTDQAIDLDQVELIGGVDVSSTKENPVLTAGIVVWNCLTQQIVDTSFHQIEGTFPYVPGLLSFREIPVIMPAIEKLKISPDVFFVDGQGIAHPRRLGIASHLGVLTDQPTVGVAKSRLTGIDAVPGPMIGDHVPLMDKGEKIGAILRSRERCKPLYISAGHNINLSSALQLVISSLHGYRLPEPTRLAHLHVNAVRTSGIGLESSLAAKPQLGI